MGAPFVDRVTVWLSDALGAVKVRVDALKVNEDGGAVTVRVTATSTGLATPVTVTAIVAL
jgi:hypothetical protein